MAKNEESPKAGVSEELVAKLLAQNSELIEQNAELIRRLERVEQRTNPTAAAPAEGPAWGEGPDPLAGVNWSDPEQVAEVAARPWKVFLRKGSVIEGPGGKLAKGPKPNFPIADLETAFAHKHKFQEIREIKRWARLVADARRRFEAQADAKGAPLAHHWGPQYLAPEAIPYRRAVAG